jgi:hypothetical protein
MIMKAFYEFTMLKISLCMKYDSYCVLFVLRNLNYLYKNTSQKT